MGFFLTIIFIFIAGVLIFILVTMFKALQFTLTATNLYKKMISREDIIIKLLLDIRDNTKTAEIAELANLDLATTVTAPSGLIFCPSCGKSNGYHDVNGSAFCPNCQKIIA
jgi:hypothetical protein